LLLANVVFRIPELPEWFAYLDCFGYTKSVLREIIFSLSQLLISAVILITAFALSSKNASEMVARPGRFLLVLLTGGTVAVVAAFEVGVLVDDQRQFWGGDLYSWVNTLDIWIRHLVGGALFGWMYFLYRQRSENEVSFVRELTRRSLLARQVAQSKLVATRARIDPEMVAHVLHRVHDNYRTDAAQASALLDNMISYLRLAMNRTRDTASSPTAELTLCRSYIALLEAETGIPITIRTNMDSDMLPGKLANGVPLFQAIRHLLWHSVRANATAITLRIESVADHVLVSIEIGAAAISADNLIALMSELEELFAHQPALVRVRHSIEANVNRYLVQL